MNKKGFVGDLSFLIVVFFVFVITIIAVGYMFNAVNDEFQASDGISAEGKEITGELEGKYVSVWDGIALTTFALFAVALLLSVVTIGTRPEFFFLVVIIGIFLLGIAALFANVYSSVTSTELSTITAEFTYIPLIMSNFVNIVLFLIAILLVGLYVKLRGLI